MQRETVKNETDLQNTIFTLLDGQSILGLLLAGAAILSASGFVVVHSYLNQYTSLSSFRVEPAQYLSAGMSIALISGSLLIIIIVSSHLIGRYLYRWKSLGRFLSYLSGSDSFVNYLMVGTMFEGICVTSVSGLNLVVKHISTGGRNLPPVPSLIVTLLQLYNVLTIAVFLLTIVYSDLTRLSIREKITTRSFDRRGRILSGSLSILYVSAYIFFMSGLYGRWVYSTIPRYLGGGQPIQIQLYFKEEAGTNYFGYKVDEGGWTEPICLLAELTNGLLVYDPSIDFPKATVISTGEQSAFLGYVQSTEEIDCTPPLSRFTSLIMARKQ